MKKSLLLIILLVTAGTATYFFFPRSAGEGFPRLGPGAYMGTISGVDNDNPEMEYAFYLERLAHAPASLVVVMKEGWQSSLVPVAELTNSKQPAESSAIEPLRFETRGVIYELTGRPWLNGFKGELQGDNGVHGNWSLAAVSKEELSKGVDEVTSSPEMMRRWLSTRSEFLRVEAELTFVENEISQSMDKAERLRVLLDEETVLRSRAEARKTALSDEINRLGSSQEESEKALTGLVNELDLLGRITKRGKAVALARKVATRENNWYLANWRAEEDASGLEEFLIEGSSVDMKQVEREFAQADEKRRLLAEVNAERRKIAELENRLREPIETDSGMEKGQELPTAPPSKKRTLWDRIWG